MKLINYSPDSDDFEQHFIYFLTSIKFGGIVPFVDGANSIRFYNSNLLSYCVDQCSSMTLSYTHYIIRSIELTIIKAHQSIILISISFIFWLWHLQNASQHPSS